jgi:hypothetical protein
MLFMADDIAAHRKKIKSLLTRLYSGECMSESCRIQYDHYYDEYGSQLVLVVEYDEGSAIDEIWSSSGSLDDEEALKRFGDQQLAKLLDKMRGEGWQLMSTDETKALDATPVSHRTIYQMKRDK